jgi:hypothetical protein
MDIQLSDNLNTYISSGQKDLFREGFDLLAHMEDHQHQQFQDYSFLVFPFAKAYEGFLKQVFLDIRFISEHDYNSDHFRLGKVLSPNLVYKLGSQSVYQRVCDTVGKDLAEKIWTTWKIGRNQVFHYFPHNLRSLSYIEAENIIREIIKTMERVIIEVNVKGKA